MKPRVTAVETVPTARRQRTPPPEPRNIDEAWPHGGEWARINQAADDATKPPKPTDDDTIGRYLPGQLGRFPTVGLDEGAIPNSRPDTCPINKR